MAVDTAQKRYSMLGLAGPGRALLPPPDGGFGAAADRQQLLWLYSGIAAAEPVADVPDEGRVVRPARRVTIILGRRG